MPFLEVLNGPEVGQETELTQPVSFIGRDQSNHLVLTDRTVSRKHAVINQIEGEYVVSDLQSLRGVLVNGVKKDEAILQDGDEIALGAIRISFWKEKKRGTVTRRVSKRSLLLGLGVIGVGLLVLLLYLFRPAAPDPQTDPKLATLRRHYERGVQYFNEEKDFEAARREWKKVLSLDPAERTDYARKASKLLENLEE